ncbi:2-keto-3-deoxygalactonate kinase [Enterobacter cancerogenus]|uniref:2-keto-3-deoxygalactonate kinase n=1 Tax=Enterobacter cancerogenus TaxID=69218 RepID=A0A484WWQ5_9ENTR|nr:2-keto-3-deoxygalactonate kinase [Enterobacter cancerogenus]
MTSRYIAIDWGSTNLRAWLYQGEQCLGEQAIRSRRYASEW